MGTNDKNDHFSALQNLSENLEIDKNVPGSTNWVYGAMQKSFFYNSKFITRLTVPHSGTVLTQGPWLLMGNQFA